MTSQGSRLSPQQRRLCALHPGPEADSLRALATLELRGPLDAQVLRQALEQVSRKHEVLRTTIGAPDGGSDSLQHVGNDPTVEFELIEQDPQLHELSIKAHACCLDPASLAILMEQIAGCYASMGTEGVFDQDAMQYADIAEWFDEVLGDAGSRPGVEFWAQRAEQAGATLALPFEAAEPGPFAPNLVTRALEPEIAASIAAAAAGSGVSTRTLMLSAWCALLRRLGAQAQVLVGVGADGRAHEQLADSPGLFSRYLPLPLSIETTTPFTGLLAEVDAEVQRMESWQDCFSGDARLPFGFDYHTRPDSLDGGGVTFTLAHRFVRSERFKCRLVCEEIDDGLGLTLDYDAAAYREQTMERLVEQLLSLVQDACAHPDRPIGRLDALGAAERSALIHEFNDTDAPFSEDLCAHHWIEQQAAREPDRVAVRQGDIQLTYGELETRANQLAHHLQAQGVGPDSLVALCIDRSVEMVVAILGILKAGGAYVPVDPVYPAERIRFLIEDTRAPVLVTQASLLEQLGETGAKLVCLDRDAEAIAGCPTEAPPSAVTPDNLVYVIYTSGSTGKPKGVVITHRKLVISNTARVSYFGHTPDTFLLLSSVAFDSSVVGIFWTLCGGGTLELIPEGLEKEVSAIPGVVAAHGVTHLLTLPSFYRLILEHASAQDMGSLETVIVAGEACPLKMVDQHRSMLEGVGLFSEYGATETTVFSSVYDCLEQTLPIAPVGSPIDNAQMYVLDEDLQPCPTGVAGEVHFGGVALALGYLRRPELTAERFIAHPFSEVSGARLYKSGDLARHLENGDVEFLGRLDNQVKIRGFRIELEEIEVALLRHPAVKESAVLARADLGDEKRLVGYVLPESPTDAPSIATLREFLLVSLPDFMVPAVFVFLDDFPRTPNGKVDRERLPEPGSERPELESSFAAPSSTGEQTLAGIWAEVLGLESVGVNDNFFELGGDSILSIQIVSRAKQAGMKLTPLQLFNNQTVATLAAVADYTGAATQAEQGAVVGAVPLTPVQRWFLELDVPRRAHWNMPLLLEAQQRLEADHIERALVALVDHHDALRLRLRPDGAQWSQEIAAAEEAALLHFEDLSEVADEEQDSALADRAAAHHAALDLERGPLMRAVLFERGAARPQRLLWIAHHLVVDGVSWRVLVEDLDRVLGQLERGESISLPAKTTSFKDWAQRLQDHADAPERRVEAEAWASRLAGAAGQRGDAGREAAARRVSVALDEEETRALLSEVPRTYNTQINDVLLTALVHALAGWTRESSLLLNLEGHGREEIFDGVDLARTVGWFTTDYPVLLEDTVPFEPGSALRSIKEQLRSGADQGLGFGVARYMSRDTATVEALSVLPRPGVGFNYMGQFDQAFHDVERFRYCEASSGQEHDPKGERAFPLEVYGMVSHARLQMEFEYSEELHPQAEVESLAGDFMATLRGLIDHCLSGDAGGFTASDFSDFSWGEQQLGAITGAIRKAQADAEATEGEGS